MALSLWITAPSAHAYVTDSLIEGAKLCTRHLPRYEREYAIPTHLLSAIASTESGRYHEGLGIRLPWPWTINVEGKGYYFNTKTEAIAAVKKHQLQGKKSIDIGCMQVNLAHHPRAFSSLDQAFEPEYNVAYAASFLRSLYQEGNSWKQAAADYHSKTPARGTQYVGQVYNSWYQIIDKLRAARLQVPTSTLTAMNESAVVKPKYKSINVADSSKQRLPEQSGKKLAEHQTPRMKVIEVTRRETARDTSRENGIIIVRPEIKVVDAPAPVSVAAAQPKAAGDNIVSDARIIQVNTVRPVNTSVKKTGPTFIFNN